MWPNIGQRPLEVQVGWRKLRYFGRMTSAPASRMLSLSLAVCAVGSLILLANHPAGGGHELIDILRAEARDQRLNGLVHGGFIVTLSALVVCFAYLSRVLGLERVPVLTGLVMYCIGCGTLMASMLLDGLALPALAGRLLEPAALGDPGMPKALLLFSGTLIRFLMPMGLLFQAAGMFSWSIALVGRRGWPLASGVLGFAVAIAVLTGIFVLPKQLTEHVLLGAIVGLSLWYLAVAAVVWPSSRSASGAT